MDMESNAQISREYITRLRDWAQTYFSEILGRQGFVSYNGEDTSWYRLADGQLLQSVYLYGVACESEFHVKIGYGIHPLFIKAPIPQQCRLLDWVDTEVMTQIHFFPPMVPLDGSYPLMFPATAQHGAERLREFIFPLFEQTKTMENAYAWYKARYQAMETALLSYATPEFIDWAIYMKDRDVYPMCLRALEQKNTPAGSSCARRREAQIGAMNGSSLDEYIRLLEAEAEKNALLLREKLGIQ